MRRHFAIAVAAVGILPAAGLAADGPTVRFESVGGSRLVGTLKVKTISIKADFGTVEVEPAKLKSATFADDGDTIVTTSGSTIKGKIAADAFEVDSEFGTLKLDRAKLKSMTVGDAKADGPKSGALELKPEPKAEGTKPGPLELKPDPKADADRPGRPSPIPRYLTHPTSTKVTRIGAARPTPRCVLPPNPAKAQSLSVSGSMKRREIKP